MGYFCFRKICAAAARLAAALVLFGGSLLGGEALLAAAGGGNVAHAQVVMTWDPTAVSVGKIGGVLTWTGTDDNWGIDVNQDTRFGAHFLEINGGSNANGTNNPKTYTFPAGSFNPGKRYWFVVWFGDGSNQNLFDVTAPQAVVVGAAVSISATFGGTDSFDADTANLTWGKDANDVDGWDIEVRQGSCSGQSCTAPLVASLTAAAAARSQAFSTVSFARGSEYSFRIRGKDDGNNGDWANGNFTVAVLSEATPTFTMGWSADTGGTVTTFGGTLHWNFAPADGKWGLAVYRGICAGSGCGDDNLVNDHGGAHGGGATETDTTPLNRVFAATTFVRGADYTFIFRQGDSAAATQNTYRAPGNPLPGEAVTAAVTFGGSGNFEQTAHLTWEKNFDTVTGWEIEVRQGTCSAANCDSAALVTSFTAAATATSRAFGAIFIRGLQYSFRIRGVNGSETSGWHNNNQGTRATPANLGGSISQFKMYWQRSTSDPNKFSGTYRWNGSPQNGNWGLAVYRGRCDNSGPQVCTANANTGNRIFNSGGAGTGGATNTNQGGVRSTAFTNLTLFDAGQEYSFHFRQGSSASPDTRYFTAPGGVGSAVSVGVSFGSRVTGNVNANLTWGRTTVALTHWDVEVRQGQCSAVSCSAPLVTSFTNLPASARSQAFGALFARGTEYSFRIRGYNGSEAGNWHNANMGLRATPATLATPETPVLSRMDDGLRLYLVQSSVNSAYVAAFDDGTGIISITTYQPANVTAGGVFNVGNIQINRYAFHDVLVTIWGAHADGFASTLSGASIIVTAYNSYAKPAPTPMPPGAVRNESAAAGSPGYAGVTISWDPPANIDGVNIARYEVSYGGTVTVSARQSGSHGVSLFSNLFGLASDYSKTIPVTLRAVSDAGVYGPPVVVTPSNSSGNIDSWKGAAPDTDNIPRVVRVEPFLKNPPGDDQILFRVFIDVDRAYKMENFRFNGFQGAGLQNTENTEVEGGFGSYQLLDAFNQIIMVTVDTVDEGEINASAFPSGTYSIRIRSFNGVWGTHGTPPPEQFSPWYEFSYNVNHFTTGDLSALNAESGDGYLVVNGTYNRPANVDNRVLPYQYIHPVGGNTIDVQGAGGFRSVIDGLINGVAYTVSARLGDNSWQTAVGTPYSADAPTIVAFLGDDTRLLSVEFDNHSNVATLRWEVNFDNAQNPRVELMHRGVAQTLEHDLGTRHYSHLVSVVKNEEHVYTIRAHSNSGSSGFATATVFLPSSPPSAPANAHASPARGGFTVRWTTPTDTGGAGVAISHYEVVALHRATNGIAVSVSVTETSGEKSYVVSGAPLGVRQCLAIRAYNTAFPTVAGPAALACAAPGDTPIKPVLNPIFTGYSNGITISLYQGQTITVNSSDYHRYFDPSNPSVGYNPFSSYDGKTVELFWNRSNDLQHQASLLGGAPAAEVEYLLSYADANGMTRNKTILGRGGVTLNSADGIKYGTPYVFTLRAQNSFGASPANVFSLTTYQWPALPPSPPRNFVAKKADTAGMVRVSWGLPIGNNFGGRPSDKTHADLTYRIIYYPLKDGTQQVSQVTILGVVRNVTTTVYPLANYATVDITTAMAMQAEIPISVTTVDWRFYIQSFNSAEITPEVVNTPPSYIGAAGSWPLVEAVYDYYADDAEASRGLEMRNVAVGVSDLSQNAPMEGFTISWDEPQNADGDGWPAGVAPGQPPESTTLSRWIRVIILAQALPGSPPSLTYAHHDIIQQRGAGGGWGVEYANGSALSVFQTCAAGCRNANNTGANLNLAFDYSRKYRFTLVPYVRNNIAGVNYWGKATVVQVAPYIHPTTLNAGKPYNVRAEGGSITWLPLGIGTGHGNISLSHYELTELTGGGIEAVPLSPGNLRKQLVFTPAEEANAGKHTVSLMSPQSNKGVFRDSKLTTPIPLRVFEYAEEQVVDGNTITVTSTYPDRSLYYRVQTFFKSHIYGHVFAAQNGVVTVQYTPPRPPEEVIPDAPANLTAAFDVAEREMALSWTRPDDKGYRILDYALLYNGFAAQVSGHLQAYTLAMRPGVSHTVQLVARNGNGAGATAMIVATSPARAPEPPVIVAVKPGNGKISVRWQAPASDGGAAITGYIARSGGALTTAGGANARSYTFTGLSNGTIYTLGIYAGNGHAPNDSAIAFVTAAPHPTRPGAPSNFALTANGHASLGVSWQAPSDTGGAAISRYLVYLDGFVAIVTSGTSAQLTGLAFGPSGISYNVAVAAQNARGEGAKAAGVATVMGKPGEPRNLEVVGGANIAVFYWEPANNAGSELLGYTITYANASGVDTSVSVSAAAVEHTISGLGNGVYTYTMFAYNALGNGETVFAANVTSTVGPPFRPASVGVNPGSNQIGITWGDTNDNGGTITAFLLYDGDTLVTTITNTATRTYTFTGLTVRGQVHTLGVAAQNAHGIGVRLNFVAAPLATPGAPANFVATPGFQQISLSWSGASVFGGTINGFFLSGTDINGMVSLATNVTSTLITGLTTNREYTFTLRASNTIGLGSEAVVRATPPANFPSAPQNVMVESILNSISLSWAAVADNGDDPNITYEVYANNTLTPVAANLTERTQLFTVGMLHGLTVGSTSTVGVAARNSRGASPIVFATVTVYGAPSAPILEAPEELNGEVVLRWSAPASNGGLAISLYEIAYSTGGGATTTLTLNNAAALTATVTGITNDQEYSFAVRAVNHLNRLGGGDTATTTATPKSGPPGSPSSFTAAATSVIGEILLTWGAPNNDGGSAITAYVVYVDGMATTTLTSTARSHTIIGLATRQNYSVGIAAANINGEGGQESVPVVSPLDVPGVPISVSISAAYPTVAITWAEGETYNGPISDYVVNGTMLNNGNARSYQHTVSAIGARSYIIYAVNVGGNGDPVTVSITVNAIAPKAPNLATPEVSPILSTGIDINWTAPANNGGADIDAYIIYVNGSVVHTTAADATTYLLTMDEAGASLEYGTTYSIEVAARNSVGIGDKAADLGSLLSAPGMPQNFMVATEGDGQLVLSWGAAPRNGADVINYFLVKDGATETLPASARGYTVRNLQNGLTYGYSLYANNSEGNGATATASGSPGKEPGAPRNLRANLEGGAMATVEWSAPADNGGRAINGYELRYIDVKETGVWMTITLSGDAVSAIISGLNASLNYRFQLRAESADFGYGARATFDTEDTAPAAPGNLMLSSSDSGMVTVSWTPPNNGGRILTGYNLRYIAASLAATAASWMNATAAAGATMTEISVTPSVNYRFSLQAVNGIGGGDWVGAESDGNQVAELDSAILPVAAAALSRQWSQAINQRLSQVGAVGGGGLQANALGANFGKGQMERGVAELLRKHGGALANGQKLDGDALRNLTFSLGGGSGAGAGATGGGMGAGYSKLLNGGGIWGGASYTNMENKKGETPWEGDNIAYYAGIDRAIDADRRLLAGVMFAHNRLETDYTKSSDNSRGEYNLRATGAHPYLLWRSADNASRLWATFGYGAGEVEFAEANQAKTTRDAKIYSAAGGLRRNLWSNSKGAELDGQADFAVANIEVDNPGAANAKADSKNFRALLEARNHFKIINGGVASPFMRAGFRHQSDDIDSKSGWEFSAGWRWNAKSGGWNGEVSGGAAGLSGGYKEWNANAMLRKNDTGGKGLWLTLRPQYGVNGGNPVAATGDLWRAMTSTNNNANERAASLSLDVGYGLFGASALWRPFVGATVGDNAGEYRAGAKWEHRLRADMGMSAGVSAKRKPAAADQMQLNFAVTY